MLSGMIRALALYVSVNSLRVCLGLASPVRSWGLSAAWDLQTAGRAVPCLCISRQGAPVESVVKQAAVIAADWCQKGLVFTKREH